MKRVYLINISCGLAGIERRFANICKELYRRERVFPILVIPSSLASKLQSADLLPPEPDSFIIVPETRLLINLLSISLPPILDTLRAIIWSRITALGYRNIWHKILKDPEAILHIGMVSSALKPPDIPAVFECVASTLERFGNKHYRRASKRRCIIHCQTERIRSAFEAHYSDQVTRWQTITNPTYFAQYEDFSEPVERDPKLVAFVGRFHSVKNPLIFIEAIALAKQRGCDCHAIMLGEGPLRNEINTLIKYYTLDNVISIEFHPKPTSIIRKAAIYMSLQTNDNFGSQALLEAMGAGCAVIASDVGETDRIVTNDVGIRVPLNAESVSRAIELLVNSPERTRQLGDFASKMARTIHSVDRYASFLESLYEKAFHYHSTGDKY